MKNKLLTLFTLPLLLVGCSKDDNAVSPSGPKEYQVEYRITAVKYSEAFMVYRDATGTQVTESNVALPKTYTFKRTMKSADVVSCGAFPTGGDATSSVKCTILLDGKEVDSKSESGPDPQPVSIYLIP